MEDDRQPQDAQLPELASTADLGAELRDKFLDFLEAFTEADAAKASNAPVPEGGETELFYVNQVHAMRTDEKSTLFVDFCHVDLHDWELARTIETEFLRVETYLRKAVQALVRKYEEAYLESEQQGDREFWVAFYNKPQTLPLRQLKTGSIGQLTCFKGTVTRSSEVRPELYLATFMCLECQHEVANVQQQYKFTQPLICPNETCGNRKQWLLVREKSTFVDWQRVKVQELSEEVPAGSLPRTMDVILRNDIVEAVRAGDKVEFTGSLIVVPDISVATAPGERITTKFGSSKKAPGLTDMGVTGMRSLGVRELTYKLCFAACYTMVRQVAQDEQHLAPLAVQGAEASGGMVNIRAVEELTPEEVLQGFSDADAQDVEAMVQDPQVYQNITRSIAPGVHGHEDVKRAIALMLFGGVHKQTSEGINLRGDINVAIVGDPSCAKSQLLKYVAAFLPRAVYTSGKSSSAAGLTATVVKETDSNEFCIEAGALMLADNGICCIDEFDKMDVKDQVAIHEAMEQQTISIAKAGIQATLNARTSILAAANPVAGRYDRSKPLKYNVALPPAILSRFDLMHVMIDQPDEDHDRAVAGHILAVHQLKPAALSARYSMAQMQRYIKYVRAIKPQLSEAAAHVLVESYKSLRGEDAQGDATAYRITVRQLEALVRLSEALARAHAQPVITPAFVREATRLVKHSIIAIEAGDVAIDDEAAAEEDPLTQLRAAAEAAVQPPGTPDAGGAQPMEADDAAAPSGGAASPAAVAAPPAADAAPAAAGPQQPRKMTVSRKEFDQIRAVLLLRLRQVQEEAEDAGDESQLLEFGVNRVAGAQQRDLITWYFDLLADRGQLEVPRPEEGDEASDEAALWRREVAKVERVISHLIVKDGVLVVVDTPARGEDEDNVAWARRRFAERKLAVNPNYVDE